MAGSISGRYAAIKFATDTIEGFGEWTIKRDSTEVDDTEFGDGWESSNVAMKKWTASMKGHVRVDGSQQAVLEAAYESGELITDIRFYIDNTYYFAPDLVTSPNGGVRVKSLNIGQNKRGIATLDVEFSCSGAVTRYPS